MNSTLEAFSRLEGSPWTVPNAISVGGLALAADGILHRGIDTPLGLAEVGVAFLSDNADGWFARKFDQATELGAAVDAVVDKIKQTMFIVALLKHNAIPLPSAAAILGVNVANAIATNQFETNHPDQHFMPSIYGKVGAFLTNSALGAYAAGEQNIPDGKRRALRIGGHTGVAAGVGLSVLACVGYFKRA